MAEIYLVRHTKVDISQGVCYGKSDVPVAPTFIEESQKILEKFKGITINTVYSSPMSRCTQLANIFTSNYIIDNRLIELDFGDWEGKTWEEIYQTAYGKKWMNNYLELPTLRGETYQKLYDRVTSFIKEMDKINNCLIITHAGVMRAFMSYFKQIPIKETFKIPIKFGNLIVI